VVKDTIAVRAPDEFQLLSRRSPTHARHM